MSNQEQSENIRQLKIEIGYLVLPLLPSAARQKFADLFVRLGKEELGVHLRKTISVKHLCSMLSRVADQRDACQAFAEGLLKAAIDHDPEFFKAYFATFERLRREIYIQPPSEQEAGAEVANAIRQVGLTAACLDGILL